MTEHSLKTFPAYWRAVADGRKPWTLRLNDRGFKEGDVLRLLEWDPVSGFTGQVLYRQVTYMLDHGGMVPGLVEGYVILSLAELPT